MGCVVYLFIQVTLTQTPLNVRPPPPELDSVHGVIDVSDTSVLNGNQPVTIILAVSGIGATAVNEWSYWHEKCE